MMQAGTHYGSQGKWMLEEEELISLQALKQHTLVIIIDCDF